MPQFLVFVLIATVARAVETLQPAHPHQLPIGTSRDFGAHVATAKTIAFNRSGLERLFPELRGQSDQSIERWIVENCAFVNINQSSLDGIRSEPIRCTPGRKRKNLFIQPGVGRGADIRVGRRMLNLKAIGSSSWNRDLIAVMSYWSQNSQMRDARTLDHSSGLETYYIASAEYLRHFILERDLDRAALAGEPIREVVAALALLDLGFDIIAADERLRAFAIVREPGFGRVDSLDPTPQIYADYGFFQETNSGARVDFGGVRTGAEAIESLADRAKLLGPGAMKDFVRENLALLDHVDCPRFAEAPDWSNLGRPWSEQERAVDMRVLGRYEDQKWSAECGDTRAMTALKVALFRLRPRALERRLSSLSDEHLSTLLMSARGPLKIPLPRAAYLHAFGRGGEVAEFAAGSAVFVLERHPVLHQPMLEVASARISAGDQGRPSFVEEVLATDIEFEGHADLLLAAMDGPSARFREVALKKLNWALGHAISAAGETNLDGCNLILEYVP